MKKFILSTVVILAFIAYALNQNVGGGVGVAPAVSSNQKFSVSKSTTPVSLPISVPVSTSSPVLVNNVKYRDGTYAGSGEYAYSDYVQVSAVISGGKLTDVQFSSSSNGPGRSRQIYSYSMPQLKTEAISVQSANVDTISGATYTSDAFQKSLASALAKAVN